MIYKLMFDLNQSNLIDNIKNQYKLIDKTI